jgi:TfoX/Sxy family transcriptional regulator of competence genes
MAHDSDLADRLRELLARTPNVTERKMFGGITFLVRGNMAIAASGQGGLLVRAHPAESEKLVATAKARPLVMRGRPMAGWLRVSSDDVRSRRALMRWIDVGTAFARSLPPKR